MASNDEAALRIEHLTKVFTSPEEGKITAVDDLNLEIEQGEFIVFVGPSGCGKTTTLRCIAGLETPTDGRINLDGKDITDDPPQQRDIAMVFQSYALYPHLTVEENLGFGLKNRTNLSQDEIQEKVREIAEMMDIQELLKNSPQELSGGQQQRVATGRAIVREPALFLFDEPLSNLDARLRKHMRTEIKRIQADLDTTSVYVTHDQEEAMTMADRIVILNDGKLQQIGTPFEVYNNPANRFVAQFIGEPSVNLFSVEFDGERVTGDGVEATVPREKRESIQAGQNLTLAVRPQDLQLSQDASHVSGTVEIVESLGDKNVVYVEVGGDTISVTSPSAFRPDQETTVAADIEWERAHFFDESGERLSDPIEKESQIVEDAVVSRG